MYVFEIAHKVHTFKRSESERQRARKRMTQILKKESAIDETVHLTLTLDDVGLREKTGTVYEHEGFMLRI